MTAPPNTQVLQFTYESPSQLTVARDANAFADAYVLFRTQQAVSILQAAQNAVQKQVTQIQGQVADLDNQIAKTTNPSTRGVLQGRRDGLLARSGVLQQRLSDIEAGASINQNAAQIVGQAATPGKPVSPNKVRDAVLGLVAGLIVGILIAFVRERFDDRIKSPEEIERRVGAPVLAAIPRIRSWRRVEEAPLVMISDPKSPVAESYRTLGTNLRYAASREALKIVMVTSALGGEGKTTTSANLAVALARAGKRVILISADLRRPRMHLFFDIENDHGLAEALVDSTELFSLVKNPGMDNLRLLVAGPVPDDPAELLSGTHAAQVVQALGEVCDLVIVDTPPVLAVADASILSGLVDATILVMDAQHSSRSALDQARYQLENAGARIIGVVYNNFDPQAPGGYSSHDYYHQYYGQPDTAASGSVKTRRFGIRIRTRAQGNGFDVAAAPRSAGAGRSKGSEG